MTSGIQNLFSTKYLVNKPKYLLSSIFDTVSNKGELFFENCCIPLYRFYGSVDHNFLSFRGSSSGLGSSGRAGSIYGVPIFESWERSVTAGSSWQLQSRRLSGSINANKIKESRKNDNTEYRGSIGRNGLLLGL